MHVSLLFTTAGKVFFKKTIKNTLVLCSDFDSGPGCSWTVPSFKATHCFETDSYWFFSVTNSAFTPFVHSMVQKVTPSFPTIPLFFLFLPQRRPGWTPSCVSKSGLDKMSLPDDPNKQSWQGADNKESPCRTKPNSAWARWRRDMWAPAEHVGGPRGWSSCVAKTKWRPLQSLLLLSLPPFATVVRHWNFMFLAPPTTTIQGPFFSYWSNSPLKFVFYCEIEKTVTVKCFFTPQWL